MVAFGLNSRLARAIWGVSFLYALLIPSVGTTQAVGRIDGKGDVTTDGGATYTVPLRVPPGRGGVQPELRLFYNSQSGPGWLGLGWSLGGQSQIVRCRRTFAKDGEAREIQFADGPTGDRYCLDGQRLVMASGTAGPLSAYGADGTEYRTEFDTQAKIISYAPDAYGPTSFKVFLKGGRVLTYGRTATERLEGQRVAITTLAGTAGPVSQWMESRTTVRYVWALAEDRDRAGNYLEIKYDKDQSGFGYDLRPRSIHYTGFAPPAGSTVTSLPTRREIRLVYENRPDAIEVFVSGLRLLKGQRLRRIESWAPNEAGATTLIRTYELTYRSSIASQRSLLESIRECDGSNVCKPATTFNYTEGDDSFADWTIAGNPGAYSNVASALGWQVAEVDGDGRDDLLTQGDVFHGTPTRFSLVLGGAPPGSQFSTLPAIPPPSSFQIGPPPVPRYVDINGDGIPDRVALEPPSLSGPPGVSTEPGVYRHTVYLSGAQGHRLLEEEPYARLLRPAFVLDLNGDGRPDQFQPVYGIGNYVWRYRLNVNGAFGAWINTTLRLPMVNPQDPNGAGPYFGFALDPTGSGKLGLVAGGLVRLGAKGLELATNSDNSAITIIGSGYCDPNFLDLNGDGLLDWAARGSGDSVGFAVNTGNGFPQPTTWSLGAFAAAWPNFTVQPTNACDLDRSGGSGVRIIDYNSDGKQDLLLMAGYPVGGTRRIVVLLSTGNGFVPQALSIEAGAESGPGLWKHSQVLDLNGDGLSDFAQRDRTSGGLHAFVRGGVVPDLLSLATDGMGAFEAFEYAPLSYGAPAYTVATTACSYPLSCVRRGLWVVTNHSIDSGETLPRTSTYSYGEGRTDLELGEWLGFGWRSVVEDLSGRVTTTAFDNRTRVGTTYPFARLPSTTTVRTRSESGRNPAMTRVRTSVATYALVNPTPRSLFVYPSRLEEREVERKSDATATLIRHSIRTESRDDFNNVLTSETEAYPIIDGQATGIPSRTRVVTAYDNFTASWLIGLSRSLSVISSTPDSDTAAKVIEYDFLPKTGQIWKTRIEPGYQRASEVADSGFFRETTYDRDAYGSIIAVHDKGSGQDRIDSFGYDPVEHIVLVERRNSLGHGWLNERYDPGLGLATLIKDPNDIAMTVEYDGFGRTQAVKPQGGANSTLRYDNDPFGRLRITIETQGAGTTELLHDRLGREIQRTWEGTSGRRALVETAYDPLGRKVLTSVPRWGGEPARYETLTYDDMDRLVRVQHADGSFVTFSYDLLKMERTDEKGNRRFTVKDELGRVATSVHVGAGGRELVTRLEYGPFDFLRRVIDPAGNVVEMEHDQLGRRIRTDDPNTGTSTTTYNSFGDIKSIADDGGRGMTIGRDFLGRPTVISTSDGTTTLTWDTASNGIGRLASAVSPDGVTTTYQFDQFGRPARLAWELGGELFAFDYSYDSIGRLQTLTYPAANFSLAWTYTPSGFIESVREPGGAVNWAVDQRDASGRITSERSGNGSSTTRKYDENRGWLRSAKTTSRASGLMAAQDLEFEWEPNGNLFRRYERIGSWAEEFRYDPLDRLTAWEAYNLSANTRVATTYGYDDIGDMRSRTIPDQPPGQETVFYRYGEDGAGPSALTGVSGSNAVWDYDRAGNRTSDPGRSVDHSALNLPRRVDLAGMSARFLYDFAGRRVAKSNGNGESVVMIGGLYERRQSRGSTDHVFMVPGEGRIIAQYRRVGTSRAAEVLYLHDDHLGSIESITDSRGALAERRAYDPLGNRQNPADRGRPLLTPPATSVSLGFTSRRHDDELGLIDMLGRVYVPTDGHFLSADPVVADATDGRAWNRYAYAMNNPTTLTDPTGLQTQAPKTLSEAEMAQGFHYDPSPGIFQYQPEAAPGIGLDLTTHDDATPIHGGGSADSSGSAKPASSADDKGTKPQTTPADLQAGQNKTPAGATAQPPAPAASPAQTPSADFPLSPQPSLFDVIGGALGAGAAAEAEVAVVTIKGTVEVSLGTLSAPTALGTAPVTAVAGIVGAGVFGWGVGSVIDWAITNHVGKPGKSLGVAIYDFLHPEENLPAYDPTTDPINVLLKKYH